MGTGIGHYIPMVAYYGFWVMSLVSVFGRPVFGLYYLLPFLPYRTMREHFYDLPLGTNVVTILVVCIIVGALLKSKRLPPSRLYVTWVLFGVYLYLSMWIGMVLGNEPAPLWVSDLNFSMWKDYMLLPLLFVAAGLVVEDRKTIRMVILITAISLFLVDKSALAESLSRSWSTFDEDKRGSGPLSYGSNQLAAFLAQFGMFFWGFAVLIKRFKVKVFAYALVALTLFATMYTFSRGGYLALMASILVLAVVKDRKLLLVLGLFLFTWQTLVPTAVTERISMTHDAHGALDASAQARVVLWEQSEEMFLQSPVIGIGFAAFQYGEHIANLKDTHNWYVKVLVETGIIGGIFALILLVQMVVAGFRLFRSSTDPLYQALGLGFLLAVCSCIVANCFGDRWTYIEINGLLWVLAGAVARAQQLTAFEPVADASLEPVSTLPLVPQMEWK